MAAKLATTRELPKELAAPLKGTMGDPVEAGAAALNDLLVKPTSNVWTGLK